MNNHKEKKRYLRPMVEELEMCGEPCLLRGSYSTDTTNGKFNAKRGIGENAEEYGTFEDLN